MATLRTTYRMIWIGLAGGAVMTLALYLAEWFAPGLGFWHRVVILLPIVFVVAILGMRMGVRERSTPRE